MAGRFLDDNGESALRRSIGEIEKGSAVEVVVSVRERSTSFIASSLGVAIATTIVALVVMMFVETEFSYLAIVIVPFLVGAVAGMIAHAVPAIGRVLVPRRIQREHVLRAARATFVERGVHATRDRSGMLVYISIAERDIAVVADVGLAAQREALERAERDLAGEVPAGASAVATKLASLAPALAAAMPRRADDANELPDAVDRTAKRRGPRGHRLARPQ